MSLPWTLIIFVRGAGASAGATAATRPPRMPTSITPSIPWAGSMTRPPRKMSSSSDVVIDASYRLGS